MRADREQEILATRLEHDRAMAWWTAMMPLLEKRPTFEAFTGTKVNDAVRVRRWIEAWDKVDRALERNG